MRDPLRRFPAWLVLPCTLAATAAVGQDAAPPADRAEARARFEDARFGLAIHWGVDALLAKGERVMERDRLPISEYEKLPARFQPAAFDPAAWARAAKAAGARYLVVNAKHHDGFCLFDSKLTRYDVVDATPFGKDVLRLLADACRAERLPLHLSYSLLDWHHPDYFPRGQTGRFAGREEAGDWSNYVAYFQGQVRELLSNYGPIAGIRFEGLWDRPDAPWDLEGTYKLIRELQPLALIANDHRTAPGPGEDVQLFDRAMPGAGPVAPEASLAWEVRESLHRSRGHDARDATTKETAEVVRSIATAAGHGANLLLNVAAMPDGSLPKGATERLAEVGRWLGRDGSSIYGTRPGPLPPRRWGVTTRSGRDRPGLVYLHVLDPGRPVVLTEALVDFAPRRLGSPKLLEPRRTDDGLVLPIPEDDRDPFDTVIVLSPKVLPPETARPR